MHAAVTHEGCPDTVHTRNIKVTQRDQGPLVPVAQPAPLRRITREPRGHSSREGGPIGALPRWGEGLATNPPSIQLSIHVTRGAVKFR